MLILIVILKVIFIKTQPTLKLRSTSPPSVNFRSAERHSDTYEFFEINSLFTKIIANAAKANIKKAPLQLKT
jgi:hypothetical protein